MTGPEPILTTADVAAALGISRRRVQVLAKSRQVGERVGRDILFRPSDLEKMRERVPGRPKRTDQITAKGETVTRETFDASAYVQEWQGRFIVAYYLEDDGRFYAPQTPAIAKATGAHTIYGSLAYVADNAHSYTRRPAALKKARELFDPARKDA